MNDPFIQELPEETTEGSVIRVGTLEAPIRMLIRYGLVIEKNSRFYAIPGYSPRPSIPRVTPERNPLSLHELESKGFTVIPGKTSKEDKVCLRENLFMRIEDAIREGYLTHDTKPPLTK